MKLSRQQELAVQKFNNWYNRGSPTGVFRIFGYAGTGKTTIAKKLAANIDGEVLFAAYTGKAAHVLTQKGCPASTIHSLIYHSRDKGKSRLLMLEQELEASIQRLENRGYTEDEIDADQEVQEYRNLIKAENKALSQPKFILNTESIVRQASLLIIDECSMVDGQMGQDLLSFGTPILVLGDPAQLPPVKGYAYFTDGKVPPDVMLDEIHRQAQESGIIRLSTMIRNGEPINPGKIGEDCEVMMINAVTPELVVNADQLIVGLNKTRAKYNRRLRIRHGFAQEEGYDPYPVAGERVICLRNNNEQGLLNGAMFKVHYMGGVIDDKVSMEILPEDDSNAVQEVLSTTHYFLGGAKEDMPWWIRKEAEEFDYGYAITGHKSQGSQWNNIVGFDESHCFYGDTRQKWAYTAVTRAAKDLKWVLMR